MSPPVLLSSPQQRSLSGDPLALFDNPAASGDLGVGATIGDRWLLLRELGRGSQCQVFEMADLSAVDREGPDVARLPRAVLKVLRASLIGDDLAEGLVDHEAAILEAAAGLPGVVRILGRSCPAGRSALHLSLAPGDTLSTLLRPLPRRKPLSPVLSRPLLCGVAETVARLHARGIVHGDLKPGNIMVEATGAPTVLDFGAAYHVPASVAQGMPAIEAPVHATPVCATPVWASPAQAAGHRPTPSDDVYALALLTARLISGSHPFGGQVPAEALRQGQRAHPLRRAGRHLREAVAQVLNCAGGSHGLDIDAFSAALRRGMP